MPLAVQAPQRQRWLPVDPLTVASAPPSPLPLPGPRDGRVIRPWGWYEALGSGEGYQVKRLWIQRGCRISLQRHRYRCEHWVVVAGDGELQVGDSTISATPGTSLFIPQGELHRATAGQLDMLIVEVQRGDWLSEDDIERLADDFGRPVEQTAG